MRRADVHSYSAPSLRAQTANPLKRLDASSTSLPSIVGASPANSGRRGASARSGEHALSGLHPEHRADPLLRSLRLHSTQRSASPPRPGSTGRLLNSSSSSPYLLGGLHDSIELSNDRIAADEPRFDRHEREEHGEKPEEDTTGGAAKLVNANHEHEFAKTTTDVDDAMKSLLHTLHNFDPSGAGGKAKRRASVTKGANDDDDEEEIGGIQDRIEAYKMARRIEPELPPLTPLPPLDSSQRLPDLPLVFKNLSKKELDKWLVEERKAQVHIKKAQKAQQMDTVASRRKREDGANQKKWDQELQRKRKQAEEAIARKKAYSKGKPGHATAGNAPAAAMTPKMDAYLANITQPADEAKAEHPVVEASEGQGVPAVAAEDNEGVYQDAMSLSTAEPADGAVASPISSAPPPATASSSSPEATMRPPSAAQPLCEHAGADLEVNRELMGDGGDGRMVTPSVDPSNPLEGYLYGLERHGLGQGLGNPAPTFPILTDDLDMDEIAKVVAKAAKGSKDKSGKGGKEDEKSAEASLFGEAGSDDLLKWGVNLKKDVDPRSWISDDLMKWGQKPGNLPEGGMR